ncbi:MULTISPECIES: DUF4870 family protein [unclassified Moraxella]|uniref:DUF4870 family protein n=1 Tax=unclassified Moraxella TaxID=2685852 RepID=UPI003AF511A2
MNLEKPDLTNPNPQPPTMDLPPFSHNPYTAPQASSNHALSRTDGVSDSLISYNHITYALAVFSYFTAGLTWIVPIVMNYLKRDEARGTWLYSHFDWQIKTFWYSIFFGVIGGVMLFFGLGGILVGAMADSNGAMGGSLLLSVLGGVVLAFTLFWHLYRMARGWIALANRKPVP